MNVYIGEPVVVSDMQGPCPDGFHVPLKTEWQAIYGAGINVGAWSPSSNINFSTYLKLPMAGYSGGTYVDYVGSSGYYWSSSPRDIEGYAYMLYFYTRNIAPQFSDYRYRGCPIRCFKDSPVIPTSSWTVLYQGSGNAGIYHNATEGLISISSNGTTWITIQDKNLGATTVYNYGDTLSVANTGNTFQWGNNYPFPSTSSSESITTSTTQVDTTGYGPGNYYSSSTFIEISGDWSNPANDNLRGGVSQGSGTKSVEVKNIYIGEYGWKPGANTLAYYKFDGNLNDSTENHLNLTNDGSVSYNTSPESLNLGTSTWLYNTSNTDLFNHDWTYNIRVYLNALPTPDTGVLFSIGGSGTRKMICCGIGTGGAVRLDFWADDHAGSTILQTGKRYNLCWTYNYSSRNYKTYINNTIDMNASLGSQYSISATEIRIGKFPAGVSDNGRINGKISNAILENIERQASEIQYYYNLTKSNYGL